MRVSVASDPSGESDCWGRMTTGVTWLFKSEANRKFGGFCRMNLNN